MPKVPAIYLSWVGLMRRFFSRDDPVEQFRLSLRHPEPLRLIRFADTHRITRYIMIIAPVTKTNDTAIVR